jgi:hypothetical protein
LKLPRDLSGDELARALRKFEYEITRQTGILNDVAAYLELDREELIQQLFA